MNNQIIIYQTKDGSIEFKGDLKQETMWGSLQQMAELFGRDKSVISRHIKNIFKEEELHRDSVVAFFATTASDGKTYQVEYFNLDVILSVGYRVNSKTATLFRQWATKTLHEHITKGFTLNKKMLAKNYDEFLQAVEAVKKILPTGSQFQTADAMELVKLFAGTWFSLDAYDKSVLPKSGFSKKQVAITAEELSQALAVLKKDLLKKKEASELFGQEKRSGSVAGIISSVFQSAFGKDAYASIEAKAAHLLYFIIKNHPFTDGNKRNGAFAFVWFLNKAKLLNPAKITPEALTALTLLVAESKPQDKEQMVGLVMLLLRR